MEKIELNNQKGFSLIQVLVAVAVLGTMSMLTASLIVTMTQGGAKSRFDSENTNDYMVLKILLSDVEVCSTNLQGMEVTSKSDLKVNLKKLLPLNPKDPVRKISGESLIRSEFLEEVKLQGTEHESVAQLLLKFASKMKVIGPAEIYRKIALNIHKDAQNRITRCATDLLSQAGSGGDMVHFLSQGLGCNSPPPGMRPSDATELRRKIASACSTSSYPMKDKLMIDYKFSEFNKGLESPSRTCLMSRDPGLMELYDKNKDGQLIGPETNSCILDMAKGARKQSFKTSRGTYESSKQCNEQYLFSQGDTFVFGPEYSECYESGRCNNDVRGQYVCMNDNWVESVRAANCKIDDRNCVSL